MKYFNIDKRVAGLGTCLLLAASVAPSAYAGGKSCDVAAYDFNWSGQIAGFIISGRFSYNAAEVPANGIVREQDLLAFDVSFYDPQGNHLRTYKDNQNASQYPTFNFAFDTLSKQILQEGTYNVDDDMLRLNNGFMIGAGDPALRGQAGTQTGLAFWSRPKDTSTPHLHIDDWDIGTTTPGAGEFGFPIGFSSHEDVAFLYRTTQNRIDDGRVGSAYYDPDNSVNKLASNLDDVGNRIKIKPAKKSRLDKRDRRRCKRGYSKY